MSYSGPKDHLSIRIPHPGSKAQDKGGIPETMVCRILLFMWSFGILLESRRNYQKLQRVFKQVGDPKLQLQLLHDSRTLLFEAR